MGAAAVIVPIALAAAQQITGASSKMQTAEYNAKILENEAQNIESQKNIVKSQYRNKAAALSGEGGAIAARAGIKLTGSTANSISQSLTQLGMDRSYELYNLEVEKNNALNEAAWQKNQKKQAGLSLLFGLPTTALDTGSTYYSRFGGGNKGTITGYTPNITSSSTQTNGYKGTLPKIR